MPFSGGTYTKWNSASGGWVGDKTAGTGILATRHDSQDDDFATAINSCLTKTGANSPTANINWAGYKITSLGNATTSGDAVHLGQLQVASGFYLDTVNNRVGINQTSPTEKLHLNGAVRIDPSTAPSFDSGFRLWSESGFGSRYDGARHRFDVGNGPTRVQALNIQDGPQLLVNTTTQLGALLNMVLGTNAGTNDKGVVIKAANSGNFAMQFLDSSGNAIGRIELGASSTSYVTTSDYRMKQNIQPMVDGLNTVLSLKPSTWTWANSGQQGQGFIAHELAEFIPDAVCGQKDAVDDNGQIIPQGVDTGYIVATLVAAVQELSAKVTALEARYESEVG